MRYLIALCIIFCGLPKNQLSAQAAQDIVYLTSGLSHQGIVIEQKPGVHIRLLRIPELDTLLVQLEDIDRIVKLVDPALFLNNPSEKAADPQSALTKPERYFNRSKYFTTIHYLRGGGQYAMGGMGIGMNWSFDDRWHIGLGAHYIGQTSTNTFPNQQIAPVTANFRFKISESPKGRFATLLAASVGYNFTLDDKQFDSGLNTEIRITDGIFFNPSITFRANILRNAGLMFDVGYYLSSGNIYNMESGDLIDNRTWHNFAARGSLFF